REISLFVPGIFVQREPHAGVEAPLPDLLPAVLDSVAVSAAPEIRSRCPTGLAFALARRIEQKGLLIAGPKGPGSPLRARAATYWRRSPRSATSGRAPRAAPVPPGSCATRSGRSERRKRRIRA